MKTTFPYRPKYRTKTPVGTSVTLLSTQKVYGCGYPTFDGRLYILAGTAGTVAATDVPTVTGPEGRSFACIDFPPDTEVYDAQGNRAPYENVHRNNYRVAAFAHEFKTN